MDIKVMFILGFGMLTIHVRAAESQTNIRSIPPKEVSDLEGVYTGSWTSFGLDRQGQIAKRAAWTDKIVARGAVREGDRAFVTTEMKMTFEGGAIPPFKSQGKDGYFLNADGNVGDQFIENSGQLYRLKRLTTNSWTFALPAQPRELAQLGFTNIISAQHVFVKVLNFEQGRETHRISRVTTVNWKDVDGKDRWLQFTSMQGFHRREMKQR